MSTNTFKASVQYGDWKGTSAADNADKNDASQWLVNNGHKEADELLIGMTMFVGENHGEHRDPISVEFLFASPRDHDNVKAMIESCNGPVPVRRVVVDIPLVEFFGLFKRFSVTLSSHEMLGEREYTFDE
jgi:hypothetical protein